MIYQPPNVLVQYVIYENPHDFPDWFVVRKWHVSSAGLKMDDMVWICETLNEARDVIVVELIGGICVPRSDDDDPVIVETWM